MTYGRLRDMVLMLLNQYTIAGTPVADSYNNQQDYLNKIPTLANAAIMEIATFAHKIPALLRLDCLPCEDLGEELRYELPSNFYQFVSGGVVRTVDGRVLHTNVYKLQSRRYLVIPKKEAGEYSIEYYRLPMLLADKPADTDELDNDVETHPAVAYYVAAYLVIGDDPSQYSEYYNKYEDICSKISPGVTAEISIVEDDFGFEHLYADV